MFQGIEGLKSLYHRLIEGANPNDEVYIISSVKRVFKILKYHILDITKKSARINLKGKIIADSSILKRKAMKLVKQFVDLEVRFIPREFLSPTSVII